MKEKKIKPGRENWQVTGSEKAAYIAGRVGIFGEQSLVPGMMNTFLIFNGVDLKSVAVFTLIVKIIDAMDDLLFGYLVDKINLKKNKLFAKIGGEGRYMPWLRCLIWFFPFAVIMFFLMPKDISETGKLIWFAVTYLLFDFTYTIVDVPAQSLTMTITDVPEERNHLLTLGMIIIVGVMYTFSIVQSILVSESVGMPIGTVGLLLAAIYLIPMFPFVSKVKEHNSEMKNVDEKEENKTYTLKEMLTAIKHNKPYLILELSGLLRAISATGTGVATFVSFYLYGSSTALLVPGLITTVLSLVIQVFAPKICKKFGNSKVAAVCILLCGLMGLVVYFIGWNTFTIIAVYTVISGTIGALATMACTYMLLQTIDYGKYANNRDTTGIFNSINTFISKVAPSVANSIGLVILSLCGWVSVKAESFADLAEQNVIQPLSAYHGLWLLTILIPAIGTILAGVLLLVSYKLSDKDAELMSKCVAGEISKEECEQQLSIKH